MTQNLHFSPRLCQLGTTELYVGKRQRYGVSLVTQEQETQSSQGPALVLSVLSHIFLGKVSELSLRELDS